MPQRFLVTVVASLVIAGAVGACTLCGPPQTTLRTNAQQARLILYGTMLNPRLNADGQFGKSATDVQIEQVLKTDPVLPAGQKKITIAKFIPIDPKSPPKFLLFCDVVNGQIDQYRGIPVKSPAIVDYLKGGLALDPKDPIGALKYAFRFIDHAEPEIAADAFFEIARANDTEVWTVARQLQPEKLRRLLADPSTPPDRLGLFAYLLGACGGDQDAAFLVKMMNDPSDNARRAMTGLLAGYISLKPKEGWDRLHSVVRDPAKSFLARLAALTAVRFFHGAKPDEARPHVVAAMKHLIPQGDLADLAMDDLRKWKIWDLTADVIGVFDRKTHDAPIMKMAIVRYALCCPNPEAKAFVDRVRAQSPEMVEQVEDGLKSERDPILVPAGK